MYKEPLPDRDNYHAAKVQVYTDILCLALAGSEKFRDVLTLEHRRHISAAALLHDIGKLTILDDLLYKPGKFTPEEFEIVKGHAVMGWEIMRFISQQIEHMAPAVDAAKEGTLYHHEWYDGTGYPTGLAGNEIPLTARIIAVADVYDALTSERTYKKPFTHEQALVMIVRQSGTHFDPDVVNAFVDIAHIIHRIQITNSSVILTNTQEEPANDSLDFRGAV